MTKGATWLAEGIGTVSSVLTRDECAELIARGEATGFEAATVRTPSGPQMMTRIRNNDRVIFEDPELALALWERVRAFVPEELDGCRATGLFSELRFYRYEPGQQFKRHRDGAVETASGERSRLTLLLYLNEDCEGGDTVFSDYSFEEGRSTRHELRVTPETGMSLIFVHELWHEGTPVTRGRKYVLRSDVLYEAPATALPPAHG